MRRLTLTVRHLRRRVGRRGAVLLLFSVAFGLIGLKGALDPSPDLGHFSFYSLLDPVGRAVLWGLPAGIGLGAAVRARGDALGFAALAVPTTFLTASSLWSFVAHLSGATPYALGWVSAVQWGLVSTVLIVCSGWTEPDRAVERHVETVVIEERRDETE